MLNIQLFYFILSQNSCYPKRITKPCYSIGVRRIKNQHIRFILRKKKVKEEREENELI
jgi:hypothetical protein